MVRQTNSRSSQRVVLLGVLLVSIAVGRASAVTRDPRLQAGFRAMYGLDFASAGRLFADYVHADASDPLGYAAESTCLVFSELNRLKLLEAEFETDNRKFLAKPAAPPDLRLKERIFDLSPQPALPAGFVPGRGTFALGIIGLRFFSGR